MQNLPQTTKDSLTAIRVTTSLLLHLVATLKEYFPNKKEHEARVKDVIQSILNELNVWLKENYGSIFGSPAGMDFLQYANEELEVIVACIIKHWHIYTA